MEYRLKRQITIGFIFSVFIFFIFLTSFLSGRQAPSCFDERLNQDEEKIDCGGVSCAPCIEFYFDDVQIISTDFLLFDGKYDAFAKIKNQNSQHGTSNLRYKFKFYDKDNNFISEEVGKSYISAGETKYIVVSNVEVDDKPSSVKFEVEPVSWQEQMRTNIKLPIFSKKYENTINIGVVGLSQVSGVIENQSNYSFVDVDLVAILMDKDDRYLAVNKGKINNLRSGERRDIIIPWFSAFSGSPVANIIVEASANIIDDSNILR